MKFLTGFEPLCSKDVNDFSLAMCAMDPEFLLTVLGSFYSLECS